MILRFRHKGLERLFAFGETRGLSAQHVKRLRRLLASLSTASIPQNMDIAGYQLHQLAGERKGEWAVSVSGNWRLVFRFEGENATDVDLVDYH
jgi:proteic killer suppression protein